VFSPVSAEVLAGLEAITGAGGLLTAAADCWPYGCDNSPRHHPPEAVVLPVSHAQVRDVVALCARHRVPLTTRGRGSGTTGAAVPTLGGVVLSLERMDRILNLDPDNRVAVVEPGVTNERLQLAAAERGFFWPPDPTSSAFCTIGGNLAYNSAGPRAVKYGTPRENTLGLRAVTGDGRELRTGTYTSKGVVGYDLTRLLIGSEGTLAVITEATLKLTPIPEAKRTLQAVYSDIVAASHAVSRIMAQPVTPCSLEFIDGTAIEMIRGYADVELPSNAGAMLMIEVDGPAGCLEEAVESVRQASRGEGLLELRAPTEASEIEALWATRKALSPALRKVAPKKINEDVAVPVSCMGEFIGELEKLSRRHHITIVNFGHAGNGNIHVNLLTEPDSASMERAWRCLDEVFDLVLSMNGTLSGEHGVGIEKRRFVDRELDPVSLDLMRRIKRQFDPQGILNPDKTLPD